MPDNTDGVGSIVSPAGFVFGVQGWNWAEQRFRSITFFFGCGNDCCNKQGVCPHDGRAIVSDQYGRPIKGVVLDGRQEGVFFDKCTHAQVIEALANERCDWTKLPCAGWPQLPYERLKELHPNLLPPMPDTQAEHEAFINQLRRIRNPQLRKDALRLRREMWDERAKELRAALED